MTTRKPLLTVRQAAERLCISTQRVYQLVESGKLAAHRNAIGAPLFTEQTIARRIKLLQATSSRTAR